MAAPADQPASRPDGGFLVPPVVTQRARLPDEDGRSKLVIIIIGGLQFGGSAPFCSFQTASRRTS